MSENLPAVVKSAVSAQKIKLDDVNLMLPTQTFGEVLGQYDKVTIEIVTVDPDPKAGDIYEPSWGKFALGKRPLNAISNAVGIIWDSASTTILESSTRKSRAKATGAMRKPNGEWIVLSDEKTVDLGAIEAELWSKNEDEAKKGRPYWENRQKQYSRWSSGKEKTEWIQHEVKKAMLQYRKFKDERAMTGAKERVIRQLLAIKATYTKAELVKPLAFPRVTFDSSKMLKDPEMRQAALDRMTGSIGAIFGPGNGQHERDVTPQKTALPEPKEAEKPETTEQPDEKIESDDDVPWETEEEQLAKTEETLKAYLEDKRLPDQAVEAINTELGRSELEERKRVIKRIKNWISRYEEKQEAQKAGGGS